MSQLLFITSNRIGDAILSTGLLSYCIEHYPNSQFTIATSRIAAPLFTHIPRLKEIIIIEKQSYKRHWWHLWRQCIHTHWACVIDIRRSAIGSLLRTQHYYRLPANRPNQARVPHLASTLALSTPPAPFIWLPENEYKAASTRIQHPLVVFAPIANWAPKQWPADYFVELATQLIQSIPQFANAQFAISAAEHERDQAHPILTQLQQQGQIAHDWIGQDLITAATHIKCADLFIGNDSGLMHLAAAVGTPTIGLFGPTCVEEYAPWGDHCYTAVSNDGTMTSLTVTNVLSVLHELIQ